MISMEMLHHPLACYILTTSMKVCGISMTKRSTLCCCIAHYEQYQLISMEMPNNS